MSSFYQNSPNIVRLKDEILSSSLTTNENHLLIVPAELTMSVAGSYLPV